MSATPAPPRAGANLLPIADRAEVKRTVGRLFRRHRGALGAIAALHTVAAVAGLAGPYLLGRIIDEVAGGTRLGRVDTLALVLVGAVVAQAVVTRFAQKVSMVFGEEVFAELREEFMNTVTRLPLSVVEKAGTGDLVARTTNDVNKLQHAVRFGVPRVLVCIVTIVLTVVASFLADPLVAIGLLSGVPLIWVATRWYLKRATPGYLRESAAYATVNGTITEAVEGARTTDALFLGSKVRRRLRRDLAETFEAEKYTLGLRLRLIPSLDAAVAVAPIVVVLWGAWLASQDLTTVGTVATIALYAHQLGGPVFDLVFWLDELQVAAVALARLVGVGLVGPDRQAGTAVPASDEVRAHAVRYAYREGHDVLHGIDLDLRPGERLAVVGPSGAGKSTLGRMLAGIHPPTGGSVTVGGVPLVELPLEDLRTHVALVTQEHHVFVGSLAENLRLADTTASDERLWEALGAVDAREWAAALPDGLETEVGSGGHALTPAQAQQVALARLVLLDPHTLVLDEATSLLDPRAARHLERSLNAVLTGRTVVAIAHRLHTAHDADRVAVVDGGRITEIGPHDDLVAAGGDYARLWHSWQHE
ncbi:ABC transporter ATP-binding protein [Isoptericola variabilis]|uniref:Xenobiotic-transporting ATPase n=1 Tax=Isoptericola variabilis (strain 225) TaxID=743718 RepID=F6FWV1_ISOV2|nr:ABC transporter ATP-binding protein [Isoptericola variabilis]AEG43523.1 Xenobiotic-transporting ATPase [Isoptericola variabilis 225]TWH32110.1 ABC-type multidrug transport system fused ATPase/permease subunit [Isoptericola variabilis J7]